jgi:Family of unknown function (DUF6573)
MTETMENSNPFADVPVIYSYSRAQAIEDGVLIDVTETAKEAGFKYPVAITVGVMTEVVGTPEIAAARGESDSGRLWDVIWMCLCAVRKLSLNHATDTVYFQVLATDADGNKQLHQLWSRCGPGDTAEPVITIMLIGED